MKKVLISLLLILVLFPTLNVNVSASQNGGETLIFQDDFESYGVGGFPSEGGWILKYDGAGHQYQVVTDQVSHSPSKSLQLVGAPMWSSAADRSIGTEAGNIGFEAYVRVESYGSSPDTGDRTTAGIMFTNRALDLPWGRLYAAIRFVSDGKIYATAIDGWHNLQDFSLNVWYKVRVSLSRATDKFDVWINDQLKISDLIIEKGHATEIAALNIGSGHASATVYFDDVRVFATGAGPEYQVNLFSGVQGSPDDIGAIIIFDGVSRKTPSYVSVTPNTWHTIAVLPYTMPYVFVNWEISGPSQIKDPYAQTTEVYVDHPGYIKAWYKIIQPLPDLVAKSCWHNPENPKEGDSVTFYATIGNVGSSSANNVLVQMYLDDTLYNSKTSSFPPSSSTNFDTSDKPWTAIAETHTVRWVVNPEPHSIQESNYSNNEVTCSFSVGKVAKWTFMAYLAMDNDLEKEGLPYLDDMKKVGSTSEVNIIALVDTKTIKPPLVDHTRTVIYRVEKDKLVVVYESPVEESIGKPETLTRLLDIAKRDFPAERYCLLIYNHGDGFVGCCNDETDRDPYLSMTELMQALRGHDKIAVLVFDACLMGMCEVAYQLRGQVEMLVASEGYTRGNQPHFPLDQIHSKLTSNPEISPQELAKAFVDGYFQRNKIVLDSTIAGMDLTKIGDLRDAVDELAKALNDNLYEHRGMIFSIRADVETYDVDFVDLYHFAQLAEERIPGLSAKAQKVEEEITNLIGNLEWHQLGHPNSHGISIFFPKDEKQDVWMKYEELYKSLDFSRDTGWYDFLHAYLSGPAYHIKSAAVETSVGSFNVSAMTDSDIVSFEPLVDEGYTAVKVSGSPGVSGHLSVSVEKGMVGALGGSKETIHILIDGSSADYKVGETDKYYIVSVEYSLSTRVIEIHYKPSPSHGYFDQYSTHIVGIVAAGAIIILAAMIVGKNLRSRHPLRRRQKKGGPGSKVAFEPKFCIQCGKPLRLGAKFCLECGAPTRG